MCRYGHRPLRLANDRIPGDTDIWPSGQLTGAHPRNSGIWLLTSSRAQNALFGHAAHLGRELLPG